METTAANVDFVTVREELYTATLAASQLMRALDKITASLSGSYASSTIGEQWARTHGEVLTLKNAAKMLGICVNTLKKMIANGAIETSPDGRVLTRSAAQWANGRCKTSAAKAKCKWHID